MLIYSYKEILFLCKAYSFSFLFLLNYYQKNKTENKNFTESFMIIIEM